MQSSYRLPLTGAILAGGQSKRMNFPKCLVSLEDYKIIDILLSNLKNLFEELFIVTNYPELYFDRGVSLLGDIYPFKGPMAGIHVALKNSKYDVFAFACDMPFIKKEIIEKTASSHFSKNSMITICSFKGKIYPLPGIYSKKLYAEIERLLKEEKLSMKKLIQDSDSQIIEVANLDEEGLSFININTLQDLEFLKQKGGKICLG